MRDYDRMVATRHKDNIAIFDSHRLIDVARVGINALENKALRRVNTMIVGFFEQTLGRNVIHIVFVRRIARGVRTWGLDLYNKEGLSGLVLGQDVADVASIGAFSARAASHGGRFNEPRRKFTFCRGASHGEFEIGPAGNGEFRARGHVDCIRGRIFKNALRPPISFHSRALVLADAIPLKMTAHSSLASSETVSDSPGANR